MALSYKSRRRWALIILLIGLPLYIIVASLLATAIGGLFEKRYILLELVIYIVLGVLWALPFKNVFKGIGREDPDA